MHGDEAAKAPARTARFWPNSAGMGDVRWRERGLHVAHHLGSGGDAMRMICRRRAVSLALLSIFAIMGTAPRTEARSAARIDADVEATLTGFFSQVRGSRELLAKSAAVLVFPSVIKAGMGIGGEYGEGALLVRGRTIEYYNTISASIGFQLGAQARSVIIVFMTPDALASFRRVDGWKVGVDGSVALITVGVGGSIDTTRIASPIVGFIFDGRGLMYNLTLEGSKISRISR
jgi:lipid-binding SYLF domain-containing protein